MWKLRPTGQTFSDQGFIEIKKLPEYLRVIIIFGSKEQSEVGIREAVEGHLLTEAGENYISETRNWYEKNPLDSKTKDLVSSLLMENDPFLRR